MWRERAGAKGPSPLKRRCWTGCWVSRDGSQYPTWLLAATSACDTALTCLTGLGFAVSYEASRGLAGGGEHGRWPISGGFRSAVVHCRSITPAYDGKDRAAQPADSTPVQGSHSAVLEVTFLSSRMAGTIFSRNGTGTVSVDSIAGYGVSASTRPSGPGRLRSRRWVSYWPSTDFCPALGGRPKIAAAPDPGGPEAAQTEQMLNSRHRVPRR